MKRIIDKKPIVEAKGGLQVESQSLYQDLERINDSNIRAGFKAKDIKMGKTLFVEHKEMIDSQSLEERGKDISYFSSHDRVAYN